MGEKVRHLALILDVSRLSFQIGATYQKSKGISKALTNDWFMSCPNFM